MTQSYIMSVLDVTESHQKEVNTVSESQYANIVRLCETMEKLPPFEQGRLLGRAEATVEANEAKEASKTNEASG